MSIGLGPESSKRDPAGHEVPDLAANPPVGRLGVKNLAHDIPDISGEHLHEGSNPQFLGYILPVIPAEGIHPNLPLFDPREQLAVFFSPCLETSHA